MNPPFVARTHELALLDNLWDAPGAQMLVVYGRRRIGKTTLFTHWIKSRQRNALYWVASPTSALAQLRSFSQAVYNFANPGAPAPETFTYATWEQAWQQIANLARSRRLALFIDEFTYLLEVTPGIAGQLQNFWDSTLGQADLLLGLSGSHMGMMKREFTSYQAPLYGRATARLHLQPLAFGATPQFFPGFPADERVALYAIFGGVPAYWQRVDPNKTLAQNIRLQLLTPNNLMQAEPRLLLQDFISDAHNYIAILTAIANGARTPKEISAVCGLPNVHIPKYLSVLAEAGFVERRIPVTEDLYSRLGRHHITDPYLRFYFRFLAERQEQLAMGVQNQALAEITRHLNDFIGMHTWEELCREWTLRAGARGVLPYLPDQVGSAWNNTAQVDVAGINSMERTLLLGECKWLQTPADRRPLVELVEQRAAQIIPGKGRWRVHFLGFSRSGWNAGALDYRAEIEQHPVEGANWRSSGMELVDLARLDRDLAEWEAEHEE